MPSRHPLLVCLLLLAFATTLAATQAHEAPPFKHENKPANLKALFELLHETTHAKMDAKKAAALYRSLVPDEARAKAALKADIAPEALQKIVAMHTEIRKSIDTSVGKLSRRALKVVMVHGATTEEIARFAEGSVVREEFPPGSRRMAEQFLRPGMTFYEVEFLEPGQEFGIKHHLLYWDGKQWSVLGPVWRVLKGRPRGSRPGRINKFRCAADFLVESSLTSG